MRKFITASLILFALTTLFSLPSFVFAENGENGRGNGKFKLQSKNQKFHIHGVVTDILISGNPASTVTLGPGDHVIILDPLEVNKFNQHGTPEIGGRAKVKGIIIEGNFFAENAHFWPGVGAESNDDGENGEEPDNGQGDTDELSVSVKIQDGEFEINAPVASASSEGLVVVGQNVIIDPGEVDNFAVDIEGPPDAIASGDISGEIGENGQLFAENIIIRPTLFDVVGATIQEVIDAIFSALTSFFSGP